MTLIHAGYCVFNPRRYPVYTYRQASGAIPHLGFSRITSTPRKMTRILQPLFVESHGQSLESPESLCLKHSVIGRHQGWPCNARPRTRRPHPCTYSHKTSAPLHRLWNQHRRKCLRYRSKIGCGCRDPHKRYPLGCGRIPAHVQHRALPSG